MSDHPPLRRILVVDDQPQIRSIVSLGLGKIARYDLCLCESGADAVARAAAFAPDLILLDMNMPQLDGLGTLLALRELGIAAPAIFFTTKIETADLVRYRAAGAIGTIAKPFDPLKLGGQILAIWNAIASRPSPAS